MFANGDVVNPGSRATVDMGPNISSRAKRSNIYTSGDVRRLIEFYVSQGLNSIDIQERISPLTGLSMQDIERLVIESGGSINPSVNTPAVIDPDAVFVPEPQAETITTPSGTLPKVTPAGPDLPSIDEIKIQDTSTSGQINTAVAELQEQKLIAEQELAELIENNKPKKRLGIPVTMDGEPIMVNDDAIEQKRQSINQINQSIEYYKKNPPPVTQEISIDVEVPSAEEFLKSQPEITVAEDAEDELPDVGVSDLSVNQYKTSDGKVLNIDPEEFRKILMSENIFELQAMIQNPEVEYGENLQEIFRQVVAKRKAKLSKVSPSTFKFGERLEAPLSGGSFVQEIASITSDFGKTIGEGLANLGVGGISGFMADQDDVKPQDFFKSERFDFDEENITGQSSKLSNQSGVLRMGIGTDVLDGIIGRASIGEDTTQSLTDIANEEKTTEEEQAKIDEAAGDTTGTSTDPAKSADPKQTGKGKEGEEGEEGEKPGGIKVIDQDNNDGAQEISNSLFGNFANFFNSEENLRMARNVGKALTATGDLTGIGIGAAAAAEERKLEEELAEKRAFDLLGKGGLEFKDRKDILDVSTKMNASIRDYNNATAAEALVDEVMRFANSNEDLTSFASKVGATVDDLLVAAKLKKGTDVRKLSDTKRAQIALDILTNANIKEILGESGRTISNIDRDIATRIAGNLNMKSLQTVAELKTRLQENLKNITAKKSEAQRNIKSSVRFLYPYDEDLLARDSELYAIFYNELGFTLPSASIATAPSSDGAIQIDATNK